MEIIGIDLGSNSLRGVRMRVCGQECISLRECDFTVSTAEG